MFESIYYVKQSPYPVLTRFLTVLSSQAVIKIVSELSNNWTVFPLWLGSEGQLFLFGDKGLQISQRHPIKHL